MTGVTRWLALAALLCGGTASAVEPPSLGSPSATTVSLPGAPGSVQGLAAAGQVSGFTGQYSYSLPVDLPPGRAGFKLSKDERSRRKSLGGTFRAAAPLSGGATWGGVTAVHDRAYAPHNPRRDAVFAYDDAMRLLAADVGETIDDDNSSLGSWSFSYAHDGLQNLTKREIDDTPFGADMPVMAHGVHDHGQNGAGPRQLTSVDSGEAYTYDYVGRMIARTRPSLPTRTLTWDAFDRLRKVEDATGGAFVEHLYGADGERMWSGWFDGASSIRENYRFGDGIELRDGRYEYVVGVGGSRTIARISVNQTGTSDPEVVYMHPGVGPGPVTLTDSAGAVLEERLYEPFGTALGDTADFDIEPTGWNAKPVDPWTTWSDHGARWLGTDAGHWVSPDPLGFGPSEDGVSEFWRAQPYVFVSGNPLQRWDPDGQIDDDTSTFVEGGRALRDPAVSAEVSKLLLNAVDIVTDYIPGISTAKCIANGDVVCALASLNPASKLGRAIVKGAQTVEGIEGAVDTVNACADGNVGGCLLGAAGAAGDAVAGRATHGVGGGAASKGPPDPITGRGYGVNDPPVRIDGEWSVNDMKQALLGHPPRGLGSPDLHHAGQMPGSGIHEVLPDLHRGNRALHPNKVNQGVTPEMRAQDRQLHWWYRAREQGADDVLPNWIYDD